MNGLENIIRQIGDNARSEIDRVNTDAAAQAETIEKRYRAQAEKEAAELAARAQKNAAEREERLVSVAQMEARKTLLAARQTMVEKAFDGALEALCALPDGEYAETVAKLLAHAAPGGQGQVLFSAQDRKRVGDAAVKKANALLGEKGKFTLSDETRNIRGGFILVNGNVEVNGSFETLVRLQRGEMAHEVAQQLFPEA